MGFPEWGGVGLGGGCIAKSFSANKKKNKK
jgi:hypothetical protein